MEDRIGNVHVGEVLKEEFLDPMGISSYRLAKDIEVQQTRISQIISGKRGMSVDTALRLGKYFGISAQFWMNLQISYDLEEKKRKLEDVLNRIPHAS